MMARKHNSILCLLLFFQLWFAGSYAQDRELDSLIQVSRRAPEDTSKVNLLVDISNKCQEKDILTYAEPALHLSEKLNYKKGKANALNNIGYYHFAKGDSPEALKYWFTALKMAAEAGDKVNEATLLNNIAFIYELQGLIEESLEYNLKSLAMREKIGDKSGMANSYNNIALLYSKSGDNNKALEFNFKALKLHKSIKGDEAGVAKSLGNIGTNYATLEKNDEALNYYKKSLDIRNAINDSLGAAECMVNIGTYYCDHALYDTALVFYNKSLKIKEHAGDKIAVATILTAIGACYLKKSNLKESEHYSREALALGKELGFPQTIRDAAKVLTQVYKYQKKYKEAFEMMGLFKEMTDSTSRVEIRNSLVKKQMQYNFEKKEARSKAEQEKKDLLVKEEKQRQQMIIYASVSGLLLVLLLAVFILRGYNQKRKANLIITRQKEEVEKAKELIEHQKQLVDEKQKEILDSIHYAKRIQQALLASRSVLDANLGGSENYFLYFNPKDIVSGDFYWATTAHTRDGDELFFLACCDSTGHGVPGAFMSLLNIGFLSEAIKEKDIFNPGEIFNYARNRLLESISKEGQKDGFDGIIVCLNKTSGKITYAAANNNPVIISNGELAFLPADKMPVGKGELEKSFATHALEYKKGDTLYLYTDGYADQFGGPKGKKFKYKQLDELLLSIHALAPAEQSQSLSQALTRWKGNLEQVDDVLVIGIKL